MWWHGALWAAGMAGCELMRVVLFGVSWGVAYRTGTRLRSAVMTMVYKKVIRLTTLGDKSIGEVHARTYTIQQTVFFYVVSF